MKTPTPFPAAYQETAVVSLLSMTIPANIFATSLAAMDFDQIFNLIEGILWIGIAAGLIHQSRSKKRFRGLLIGSAIAFFLFGISDFIEIQTRAWYRPWTLLALKVGCVVFLIFQFFRYLKIKPRPHDASFGDHSSTKE